jgi:hypothetical protein
MKTMKSILILTLFTLLFSSAIAQNLEGRKIINGTLNLTNVSGNGIQTLNIASNVLFGKIKKDNTYWAFGGNLNVVSVENSSPNIVMLGPAIERGKFVKIIDKLYIAPYFGGNTSLVFGKLTGFNIGVYASPLRFMYHFTDKFMLSAGFGSANLNFNRMAGITTLNIGASLTNNSSFGVFYTFK